MMDYTGIPEVLNERIKFIRKKHGYKQSDVADKLNVSRVTYTKYEMIGRAIPIEVVKGLSLIYSISTDFILGISAKPQYVDYNNYVTGLSPKATENLQNMYEQYEIEFAGVNKLLESNYAYKIFFFLGLLLKIPKDLDKLQNEFEDDFIREGSIYYFKNEFKTVFSKGILGIEEKYLSNMDDMYDTDLFALYLKLYLDRFIDEFREKPSTKALFVEEVKNIYQAVVEKDIEEMNKRGEVMGKDFYK